MDIGADDLVAAMCNTKEPFSEEQRATASLFVTAVNSFEPLVKALEHCDKAFVSWQLGQIPGRPEDILALIVEVRAALELARKEA